MKRFLIAALATIIVSSLMAQKPLATVSHKGALTFYDQLNCFEDALSNAINGDTIFLSAGTFTSNSETVTINKRVAIIGCGYDTKIAPTILISIANNNSFNDMETPLFDGVWLSNLEFSNVSSATYSLKKAEIRNCYIESLTNAGYAGKEVLFDRCYLKSPHFTGATNSNLIIRNSKILRLGDQWECISVEHCNILRTTGLPRNVNACIIGNAGQGNLAFALHGSHSISYSLIPSGLGYVNGSIVETSVYKEDITNNPLLDENVECSIDLGAKGYLDEYGSIIGIHGGYSPYSENPSVPTIDSQNSFVEYDSDNNKLNVTITIIPD